MAADLRAHDERFAPIGAHVIGVVPKRAAGRVFGLAIIDEPGDQAGGVPSDFVMVLGEITGEMLPDDLLGEIFSSFCIGK